MIDSWELRFHGLITAAERLNYLTRVTIFWLHFRAAGISKDISAIVVLVKLAFSFTKVQEILLQYLKYHKNDLQTTKKSPFKPNQIHFKVTKPKSRMFARSQKIKTAINVTCLGATLLLAEVLFFTLQLQKVWPLEVRTLNIWTVKKEPSPLP